MITSSRIQVEALSHTYRDRQALSEVSFDVRAGEIFGVLGPNGGGKTTLFRVLCTAMRPSTGTARICGYDTADDLNTVRRLIGVVFQHPSLDKKLTVRENLFHQGHLYGLSGNELRNRVDEMLERFSVSDRAGDRVQTLSGGLARRVDLAKGLLHQPKVLLLDEPSTGLDPQARWNLWQYLDRCRKEDNLTVLMTTHFMDEADRCDRVAIIDLGHLVAVDSPDRLKQSISGECLHVTADDAQSLSDRIRGRFNLAAPIVSGNIRIEHQKAHEFIPKLVEAFPEVIRSVSLSKPTLEEVFMQRTGHAFEGRDTHD